MIYVHPNRIRKSGCIWSKTQFALVLQKNGAIGHIKARFNRYVIKKFATVIDRRYMK